VGDGRREGHHGIFGAAPLCYAQRCRFTDVDMDANTDYTGTHKVVLPADYMNSIEAVCELYEDRIDAVGTNLDIPGLQLTLRQRLLRIAVVALIMWLIPAIWLTCL